MTFQGTVGDVEEFGVGEGDLTIEWRIRNDVPSQTGENDDWYASPEFPFDGERWYMGLWPNWGSVIRRPTSGWLRLGLLRYPGCPPRSFHFSVGILGSTGVEKGREVEQQFSGFCLWDDFCSRSDLLEHQSRLMPDGVLRIRCVLERVVPGTARGCKKVVRDIAKLLASGENSDVTVQVGDVEFKAHKLILSVRSPVLSAMFRHETEERASSRITICDCEPEVFKQYLHFIYTGSAERLSEQNVFELYRVADKYLADDLKRQCLERVRDTLSLRTFCDAMRLAATHGESGLLEQATDFAAENIQSIVGSAEWRNFVRDHPTEANEVLMKSLGPTSDFFDSPPPSLDSLHLEDLFCPSFTSDLSLPPGREAA